MTPETKNCWDKNMADLPNYASVVVIGGGIMGCSTLYHLAKMGANDAILLERNKLTSGTTWHSAAQVRALRNSKNLTRMIQYSVDLYSQLEEETGQSVGWIQKGSLSIATNPDRLTHVKRQEALAHAYGIEAHSISPGEAKERWPLMNADDVLGAVWSPDDGRVSPSDVCAALVKAAKGLGAKTSSDSGAMEEVYDNWAGKYETDVRSWGYNMPEKSTEMLVEALKATGGTAKSVLDAGCGDGLQGDDEDARCREPDLRGGASGRRAGGACQGRERAQRGEPHGQREIA